MVDWPKVVEAHGPAVWRTVYRLLGHPADAWDCYQETFLAAYHAEGREAVRHWPSFLVSLATRRAMDQLRRRHRSRARFAPLDSVAEPEAAGLTAIDQVQGAERLGQVRALLARLPEKQAMVFWLSGVEGMTNPAIADQLQIPPGEVRVLLHRARARLQRLLGPSPADPRTR